MMTCVFVDGVCKCGKKCPPGKNPASLLQQCKLAPKVIKRAIPLQKKHIPLGQFGSRIGKLLSHIGIHKKPGCGCGRKEYQLNRFSGWIYFTCIGWWNALKWTPAKHKHRKHLKKIKQAFQAIDIQSCPVHAELKKQRSQAMLAQQSS